MSDHSLYFNPTNQDQKRAATLLVFLYKQMGEGKPSSELIEAANLQNHEKAKQDFVKQLSFHVTKNPKAKKFLFPTQKFWLKLNRENQILIRELGVWALEWELSQEKHRKKTSEARREALFERGLDEIDEKIGTIK